MSDREPTNDQIAHVLERIADLLEAQDANPFRVGAYRSAAETVRSAARSLADTVLQEGEKALQDLPTVGEGIASVIGGYVRTGRSDLLQRLEGQVAPGELFMQVPGIGEELAKRIAQELNVSTLEELEQAAHHGRLEKVDGFGPRRTENVRLALAGILSTAARRHRRRAVEEEAPEEEPSVETLLDVDAEYRRKAEAGELRKIAPKRLNPEGRAWLPILNTQRGLWTFTALYSNTARAHELDKTDDWVVLYYERDGEQEQATVVTETHGPLEGKRVVRGREGECREYYRE